MEACNTHIRFHDSDSEDEAPPPPLPVEEPMDYNLSSSTDTDLVTKDPALWKKGAGGQWIRKRSNRGRAKPDTWARNVMKNRRAAGQSYKSRNTSVIGKKTIGPGCIRPSCQVDLQCGEITEQEREAVYLHFWTTLKSVEARRVYVRSCAVALGRGDGERTRNNWFLQLPDGRRYKVCRQLVASTLATPERTLLSWLARKPAHGPQNTKAAKSGKGRPVVGEDKEFLDQYLDGLPTIPSHYCRNQPCYQERRFLEPDTTIAGLHRSYKAAAVEGGFRPVQITKFRSVLETKNFSVFKPKKDRCGTCNGRELFNISAEEVEEHRIAAKAAQTEKDRDEDAAKNDRTKSVWTMDLQAVMLCPRTSMQEAYYRKKLQVHNLTFFNRATKDATCYFFSETNANLEAETFAFLHQAHFRHLIRNDPKYASAEEFVIWSDGCGYQNRNAVVASAFLDTAIRTKKTIVQKYLIPGHTHMACDSVHARIQNAMPSEMMVPRDYELVAEAARTSPRPYRVISWEWQEFQKQPEVFFTSIRPGKKVGDKCVNDLRAIKYTPEGKCYYKTDFEDDWAELPQRINRNARGKKWVPLFAGPLPIKLSKYQDLQALKTKVIPREHHHYFDELAHEVA